MEDWTLALLFRDGPFFPSSLLVDGVLSVLKRDGLDEEERESGEVGVGCRRCEESFGCSRRRKSEAGADLLFLWRRQEVGFEVELSVEF